MIFNTYTELTAHLVQQVKSRLADRPDLEVNLTYSNQSCSAYVIVDFLGPDEDGDCIEIVHTVKIRFSDHPDRYGSDLSLRFDGVLTSDELYNTELDDWRIEDMVAEAVAFVDAQ